jgi:hypothetical protein
MDYILKIFSGVKPRVQMFKTFIPEYNKYLRNNFISEPETPPKLWIPDKSIRE